MTYGIFFGHANATVELYRSLAERTSITADQKLGTTQVGTSMCLSKATRASCDSRRDCQATCRLQRDKQFRGAMAQGLVLTNWAAELPARFQIFDC